VEQPRERSSLPRGSFGQESGAEAGVGGTFSAKSVVGNYSHYQRYT